jgi:hypothetical protein
MPKHFSKNSTAIIAIALIMAVGDLLFVRSRYPTPVVTIQQNPNPAGQTALQPLQSSSPATSVSNPLTPSVISQTFSLPIPFTPQAPTGNWDGLHNEACEEAAAIMANAYLTGDSETKIPAATVENQITTLTNWEQQNFGYSLDTTAAETATMIEEVYGLHTHMLTNYSEDDIKQALTNKEVVIIPEDGQDLDNPNYKTPAPIYHMLVIRGFSGDTMITNDSGTKNGLDYPYSFDTIYNSGADWDHSTNTITGRKHLAIIVSK